MTKLLFIFFSSFIVIAAFSQPQTSSLIFAHNDYAKPNPFYHAYALEVDYIEADVFLKRGKLLVAHTRLEINDARSLDSLYLRPIKTMIIKNNGAVYASGKKLTLMIDLKTEGDATLKVLVNRLQDYPELINSKNFVMAVSGNMPEPSTWKNYPDFIHFDGRPGTQYNQEQLARVELISDSFRNYSHWDGKGKIPEADQSKILSVIKNAHALGKPVRFWAIPDNTIGWTTLNGLLVDILNTDHIAEATAFMKRR